MTTALLVIDVQESFAARPADWATVSDPEIAIRVGELVRRSRAAGHEVVWVLHTEPGTGTVFDPASGRVRLLPGLEPSDHEMTVTKTSHNAFTSTELDRYLRGKGVTEVIVCGIRTAATPRRTAPCCVTATTSSTPSTGPRTSSTPGSPTPSRCAGWPGPSASANAP